jgi:hydroxyisourate hydrolase
VQVTDLDPQRSHPREDSVAADPGHPRPTISTHVLDTERGVPASGVRVTLSRLGVGGDGPIRMTQALTDADGRVRDLLERPLQVGDYRLEFDIAHEEGAFFTKIAVDVQITDPERSYHVPLLLAPFSMTTYRGS